MNLPKHRNGFTLIELLVVIGIIGILASATLAAINPLGQFAKARDAQQISDLTQIQKALQLYYQDNGQYPSTATINSYATINSSTGWGGTWVVNAQTYMSKLPSSPDAPTYQYVYWSSPNTDNQTYYIFTHLDYPNSPQLCQNKINGVNVCVHAVGLGCKPGVSNTCNYGVSSSNTTP